MDAKPTAERAFSQAADRRAAERERLIRQMAEKDQRLVEEMRKRHERDVLERRQLQGANRADDIRQERERLVREHPQPALRPDGHPPRQRSASDIERMAARTVDEQNRQEVAGMANNRDAAIDHLLQERGQSYEQFKGERAHLEHQQIATRNNNNLTREI